MSEPAAPEPAGPLGPPRQTLIEAIARISGIPAERAAELFDRWCDAGEALEAQIGAQAFVALARELAAHLEDELHGLGKWSDRYERWLVDSIARVRDRQP